MPRPKDPFPKCKIHIAVEQTLLAEMLLMLPSDPVNPAIFKKGELSSFAERAFRAELDRIRQVAAGNLLQGEIPNGPRH